MNPIAVACHSGSRGKRLPPTSRRMSRQRSARSGNVSVASAIVASMSQRLARRRCPTSSCASTPCSAQARSPSVTTSPTTHAQRDAGPLGVGGGLDGEGNEVADLFDERPERFPRGQLGGFTQLLRALQCAQEDRKSTRLNSSHLVISYAVFCLKKKKHTPIIHERVDRLY